MFRTNFTNNYNFTDNKHRMTKLLFFCYLFLYTSFVFSQNIESAVVPAMKNTDLIPLGEINGVAYFYGTEIHKVDITLTIYKFKSSSLEFVDSKEVFIKDFNGKVFNNNRGSCKIDALLKNNKFYFFYSLISGGDYHIYLKTLDESLSNEKTTELGTIIETGNELLGNFFVSYSPDYKHALVTLKNFCEIKKVVGANIEIYENTELINYDIINDKAIFSKKLPIELEGSRLKTDQYKIDNDGNIAFIVAIAEKKKEERQRISIKSVAVGYLEKTKEQFTTMNVDLTGAVTLNYKLLQLKNGDLFYILASRAVVKIKYVSPSTPSKNYEKKIENFTDYTRDFHIDDIYELPSGFHIAFSNNRVLNTPIEYFGVANISSTGDLKWSKSLSVIAPLYFYNEGIFEQSTAFYNNKLHVYYFENKPYELTDKIKKNIEEQVKYGVYDYKKFNTEEAIIDENGKIEKNVINDNETFVLHPNLPKNLTNDPSSYFSMYYKKNFKIKKVGLK